VDFFWELRAGCAKSAGHHQEVGLDRSRESEAQGKDSAGVLGKPISAAGREERWGRREVSTFRADLSGDSNAISV